MQKKLNILARKFLNAYLKVNVSEKSAKEAISRPEYLNIYIFTSKKYDQVQKRQYPDQMFEICLFIFVRSKTKSKRSNIPTRQFLNTYLNINVPEKKVPCKQCQGQSICKFTFSLLRNMTKCKRGNIRTRIWEEHQL